MTKYKDIKNNKSQYEGVDLKKTHIVDAVYIPSRLELDKGNPYIEALPPMLESSEILRRYTKELPDYSYDHARKLSVPDKKINVTATRMLRFPLPFHEELEFSFYNSLLTSYRSRYQFCGENRTVAFTANNEEHLTSTKLVGDSAASTNAGFSLIGYSGCGKSSAIEILVSRYPQVIIHHTEDGGYFPQITYLVVNCVPNSNFAALYNEIGNAIDKALGNVYPVYLTEMRKQRNLGDKANKIVELIEKLGIGALIIDEIQLLDFSHTRENSFESLMILANRTKVGMVVVGTEEARSKMFKELRTARRIGNVISGDLYCGNKDFFEFMVRKLFCYQWFSEPVEVTEEITDTLYDISKGIVDQLIAAYICMHYEYFERGEPEINRDFITKAFQKYYPNIQSILVKMDSALRKDKLADTDNILQAMKETQQREEAEKIIHNSKLLAERRETLTEITELLQKIFTDFSDIEIETAFDSISDNTAGTGKTIDELCREIIKSIQKRRRKEQKQKKMTVSQMKKMVFDSKGVQNDSGS